LFSNPCVARYAAIAAVPSAAMSSGIPTRQHSSWVVGRHSRRSSRVTASTVAGFLDPPLPFGGPRERQGENQSNDIASRVVIGLSHNSFTDLHDRVCPSTRAFKITSVIGLSEISVPTQMCINQQPRQFNQQPGLMDSNCWLRFECRFV
jgi:hypothetical protein